MRRSQRTRTARSTAARPDALDATRLELARTRQLLEVCNRAARIGPWELDPLTQRICWSEVSGGLLGQPAGQWLALSQALDGLGAPGSAGRAQVQAALQAAQTSATAFDVRLPLPGNDGQPRWLRLTGLTEWAGQRCQRVYGSLQDISVQAHAEQARSALARAEASNLVTSGFLGQVSHELRTPLNAVLGYAYLLAAAPAVRSDPRLGEQVRCIRQAGQHLLALVEDVMDLSAAQVGRLHLVPAVLAASPLVQECLALVQPMADAHQVRLGLTDGTTTAKSQVLADPRRLRQVLTNLLSNAIKYNRPGGQVQVHLTAQAGQLLVAVQDSGTGLSATQLAALFQPFNRLGAECSTVPGTGLGLAISRQLAQAMGGELSACSTPGTGSTFTLQLPTADAPSAHRS